MRTIFGIRPGELAVPLPEKIRRRGLFHRPHPHALATAGGVPEERPRIRRRLHHRGRSALGARARRVETCSHLVVLYWMDRARRDLVLQVPRHYGEPRGTFALRSPVRPNPIAMSVVRLLKVDGTTAVGGGLDCLDGTPLIDIKPYFASTDAVPDAVVGWHEASAKLKTQFSHDFRRVVHGREDAEPLSSAALRLPTIRLAWHFEDRSEPEPSNLFAAYCTKTGNGGVGLMPPSPRLSVPSDAALCDRRSDSSQVAASVGSARWR